MTHPIDDAVSLVRREVASYDEYTWWAIDFDGCRECECNIVNDHCSELAAGRPWNCPAFTDHFGCREIDGLDYFELLQALDAVISNKVVSFGGKKYKLTEVE